MRVSAGGSCDSQLFTMKGDVFEPNSLVFAKIRGYPAWPAKVTAPLDDSKKPKKYSVFFFGTYEVATVKVEDLFAYNEKTKEKYGNVNVKRKGFLEAMQEIESNPDMEVPPAMAPPAMAATPKSAAATPKSAAATPKSAAATPSATPKGRGRGKKRKETSPPEPTGKRRRVDADEPTVGTPAAPPAEPVLSRSGRKIKPKRFADAEEEEEGTPAAKTPGRRKAAAPAAAAAQEDSPSKDLPDDDEDADDPTVEPEEDDEEGEEEEDEEDEETLPMDVAEGGAGDGPNEQAAQPGEDIVPEEPRRDVRYKPYPAHETEDIIRVADSASVQQTDDGRKVMFVKAKCGEMLEIDISDKERPKEFKSEKARIMWDTATAINLSRLRRQLEQGEYIPDRLRAKLLARADVAEDFKQKLKNDRKAEMRKSKLWWLRDEARLIEMDYNIKLNLIIDEQNHDKCIAVYKELVQMNMAPLMLKKNPEIVETVRKCRKYTGSAEIRDLADKCYQRFKKMFVVPKGKMFREYFDEQLAMFRKVTEEMPEEKVVRMVRDPLFQRPGADSSDSEDENWPPSPPKTNGTTEPTVNGTAGDKEKDKDPAEKDGEKEPEDKEKDADKEMADDTEVAAVEPEQTAKAASPAAAAREEPPAPEEAAKDADAAPKDAEKEPAAGADAAEDKEAEKETEEAAESMETTDEPAAEEDAKMEEAAVDDKTDAAADESGDK